MHFYTNIIFLLETETAIIFLLETETAKRLYGSAKELPIIEKSNVKIVSTTYNPADTLNGISCRATDHGLDYIVYDPASEAEVDSIF